MDNNLKWKNTLDICECRKGWNNLIAELMEKIEEIYKKKQYQHE